MGMNNKLGISSYAYYWATKEMGPNQESSLSAWDLLDKVVLLDLGVLQICENLPLINWDRNDLERLGEAAQQRGVILEAGTRGLDLDSLRAYVKVTHTLGAHILRLTPWSGSETRQHFPLGELREVVDHLLPLCQECDVILAIENHFDLPDQELALFVQQVDDVHVGVCLDTANSVGFLEKPLKTVELLAPFAVSLHLKDFVVTKPTMGYVVAGVPLGQGWLNAQEVIDVVHQAGRQPNILLELWVDPAENYEATLRKEEKWVRQSVAYARHHLVHKQKIFEDTEVS